MKLNVSRELADLHGKPIPNPTNSQASVTLRDICLDALLVPIASDARPEPGQAVQVYEITRKFTNDEPELTAEQISLLKLRIENAGRWSPWIVGQALMMIEGKD